MLDVCTDINNPVILSAARNLLFLHGDKADFSADETGFEMTGKKFP